MAGQDDRSAHDRRERGGFMDIKYRRFAPGDAELLADFLTGEQWPYHGSGGTDRDAILRQVADGRYGSGSARTFWIMAGNEHAGLIWLFDLDDGTPMFDLRIRAAHRGPPGRRRSRAHDASRAPSPAPVMIGGPPAARRVDVMRSHR
jgi:hypothetical protein